MLNPSLLLCLTLVQAAPDDALGLRETRRVALLPVLVEAGAEVTASDVFRLVSEEMKLRKTLRLMSIDEFFFYDGGARATGVLACGSDTRCVARQLAPFRADLGVIVIVNGQLDPPLMGVLTLDAQRARLIDERYAQVARDDLSRALRRTLARHLDQAGHPSWAQLSVRVDPPTANVRLSPPYPAEAGQPNVFVVPPGQYQVRGELDDHAADQVTAILRSGARTEVALQLDAEAPWFSSPWVWVGAAVVVATAVTVAAVALAPETTCGCVITADRPACPPCP